MLCKFARAMHHSSLVPYFMDPLPMLRPDTFVPYSKDPPLSMPAAFLHILHHHRL